MEEIPSGILTANCLFPRQHTEPDVRPMHEKPTTYCVLSRRLKKMMSLCISKFNTDGKNQFILIYNPLYRMPNKKLDLLGGSLDSFL